MEGWPPLPEKYGEEEYGGALNPIDLEGGIPPLRLSTMNLSAT